MPGLRLRSLVQRHRTAQEWRDVSDELLCLRGLLCDVHEPGAVQRIRECGAECANAEGRLDQSSQGVVFLQPHSGLTSHVPRSLIRAQAYELGTTEPVFRSPSGETDLRDHLGLSP